MAGDVATTDHVPPVVAAPELDAGTRLGARYRLVKRLGAGGGGTVWRAFDEKVGEEVALKLVEAAADLERWRREVALARRVSHAGVCRVYDLGEDAGRRWVTMALVEGRNLRARIEEGIGDAERPRLMAQLVEAVAAIHAAGVVHRDLKPENVVVDRDDRAVIVDFGLARTPSSDEVAGGARAAADPRITVDGAVVGTPRYMAPEQARGGIADARSDVYSLGLVLHEIAGGEVRGSAEAKTTRGAEIGRGPLEKIEGRWGDVIAKATASAPDDRYAHAGAIRAALEAPIAEGPMTPAAVMRAMPRRWRLRVTTAILAAMFVAGAAVAIAFAHRGRVAKGTWPPGPLVLARLTTSPPEAPLLSVAIAGDGKTMGYSVGNEVFTRPVAGGVATPVAMPERGPLGFAKLVFVVGFFPDGRMVVDVFDRERTWSTWMIGGREPVRLWTNATRAATALSPDGAWLAVASREQGIVVVPTAGGAQRRVATTSDGDLIGGLAWSPDATRLAFVRYPADWSGDTLEVVAADGRESRVLVRGSLANMVDQLVVWPEADRIVYAVTATGGGAALAAVKADGRSAPVEIAAWPGEYVSKGAYAAGTLLLFRGTARYHLVAAKRYPSTGNAGGEAPAGPSGDVARRLAGWLPDGRAVFAAPGAGGDHDVIARGGDGVPAVLVGGAADDVPDTIAGDAVLYHRAAGETIEVWRHAPGAADVRLAAITGAIAAANVVRCAGDRAPPCVIEEVHAGELRYQVIDPVTGARGDELYRARLGGRFLRSHAVSPDGRTLAVLDGTTALTLVGFDGGVRELEVAPGAELQSVVWSGDGESVLVTAIGGGDRLFNVFRVPVQDGGRTRAVMESNHRWFWRAHESPDGASFIVQARDIVIDLWSAGGL